MTDATLLPFDLPAVHRKKLTVDFAGGNQSSDAGLLLLREAERKLGVCRRLAEIMPDRRDGGRIRHAMFEMVIARAAAIACGHKDGNDLNRLRHDPLMKVELFSIMKEPSALAVAAAEYEGELRRHRLMPDDEMRRARRRFMLAASACLIAVGGAKLLVALGAGRSNVLFLIVMMAIAVAVVWKVGNPYRAMVGDSFRSAGAWKP